MNHASGLVILGFGGHARSVADVAIAAGVPSLLFVDVNAQEGENFLGFPVVRAYTKAMPKDWLCMPAAGDNRRRKLQIDTALAAGWPLATLVSPCATIGAGATVAAGCFIAHHAHIGPMARIGTGCLINTGAIVEHECIVGNYTHVSVNATLAGRSRLGDFVFLGAGATVIDGISVTDSVMIGAGGVVIDSITHPGTYVGVPVKLIAASAS